MALASTVVMEYRATGATTNGGGFVPGTVGTTDFSLQDSPQYSFADLATTTGTTVPSIVTSASHSFVQADVNNLIHINSGTSWTAGLYQIVSVSGGAATLDKACGSAATLTAGTWTLGGALNLGSATTDSIMFSSFIPAGATVWFKKGSYTMGQNISGRTATAALPIVISGYNASRGDNPTGANRPTINLGTFAWNPGTWNHFTNMQTLGAGSLTSSGTQTFKNLKIFNNDISGTTGIALQIQGSTSVIDCEVICIRGIAMQLTSSAAQATVMGCNIHDSATGVSWVSSSGNTFINNIVNGCYTAAIALSSVAINNIIYGNTIVGSVTVTGNGLTIASGATRNLVYNNNFYGLVTAFTDSNAVSSAIADFNNYFNNTTNYSGSASAGTNDKTLNPSFVSATQLSGATATTTLGVLTDSSQNFSSVVDNQSFLYIKSGTGVVVSKYPITSHTTTTVTTTPSIAANATADKSYQIMIGNNFNVGIALQGLAFPQSYQPGLTTSYGDLGGVQRNPTADYTDPGIANVEIGTTYLYAAVSLTGTYDGSNRWSDPGVANVLSTVSYNANNVGKTGTYVVATAANVKVGVAFGPSSGLTGLYDGTDRWSILTPSDVRLAVAYKSNSTTNNETGTLDLPATTDVQLNVVYDNTTKTGSYDGSNRWSVLNVADVRSGLAYKSNSLTNNLVGIYAPVALPQILSTNLGLDSSNHLNGALWVNRDSSIITAGLGTASYTLLNPDGTSTGISQSGITNASGLFFITPVDVTSLLGKGNYLLQITITVSSLAYSTYIDFPILAAALTYTDSRLNNLDAAISSRLATSGYTAPDNSDVAAIKAKTDNLPSDPASNTQVNTRLAASAYTAPDNADIAAIKAKTDNIPASPSTAASVAAIPTNPLLTTDTRLNHLDADVSSRLATSGYTAPDNSDIAAIKVKTDQLSFVRDTVLPGFGFPMTDSVTHAPKTGLTVTVQRSIDGGAFANCTNAASEIGGGNYTIDLSAADLNGHVIALRFTATGADTRNATIVTQQ
jgi:parallel beta-helix repeat protein